MQKRFLFILLSGVALGTFGAGVVFALRGLGAQTDTNGIAALVFVAGMVLLFATGWKKKE